MDVGRVSAVLGEVLVLVLGWAIGMRSGVGWTGFRAGPGLETGGQERLLAFLALTGRCPGYARGVVMNVL